MAVPLTYVGYTLGRTTLLVSALVCLALMIGNRWNGITLTDEAAVVHSFRRRVIPWTSVQSVAVDRSCGARTIVLWEANHLSRLRAPSTGWLCWWDPQFDEKYEFIVPWWLAHGGERSISPGRHALWVAPAAHVPELVAPSSTWPTVATTGLVLVADAIIVALVTWRGRGWTGIEPITFGGSDVPATQVAVAGAMLAGLVASIVLSILARRRVTPADPEVRWRPVSSRAGVLAAVAGALVLAIVMTPLAWGGFAPLIVPAGFVAATLAVGVACPTAAAWVRRLESGHRLAVHTIGPFWLPPPFGDVNTLRPGAGGGA